MTDRTLDTDKEPLMMQLLRAMDNGVVPTAPVAPSVYTTILACPLVVENVSVIKKKIDAARQMVILLMDMILQLTLWKLFPLEGWERISSFASGSFVGIRDRMQILAMCKFVSYMHVEC